MLILDGFLAANLAEVNESLLLAPFKPEEFATEFDTNGSAMTARSNLSMLYASQSTSGKAAGRVSESKYF